MRYRVAPNSAVALSTAILAVLVALTISSVFAVIAGATATRSLTSSADTKIVGNAPTQNYGSVTSLGVNGNIPRGSGKDQYTLLKWDLSGIAPGTQVGSALVTLNITTASPQTYQAYVLKRPWAERLSTWQVYDSTKPWEVAGAKGSLDRDWTIVGTITPSATGKQSFSLPSSVVQGWVDTPVTNQGIIIANPYSGGFNFNSREVSDPTRRPQLTLNLSAATTAPETTIDSGPSATLNVGSAKYEFSSNEAGSKFECALDGGAFEACTSPKEYSGLADGSHTFQVQATDTAGNIDPTAATRTWSVDTTAPTIGAVEPAEDATEVAPTSDALATFSEAMDASTISGSTFTLDKQNADGTTTPIAAAVSYDSANKRATLNPNVDLEAGLGYTATIKGGADGIKDVAGNPLAADKIWSFATATAPPVDTTAPETTIDSGPSGTITVADATFTFSSEAGATFECRQDGADWTLACTSPQQYTALSDGSHTFEVRATDAAGNVDPTPAVRHFSVGVPPPDTDGDTVPDSSDNCRDVANPGQEDSDGDRVGDACDSTEQIPDTDGDGVKDDQDNCVNTANASQENLDGDGKGDACDDDIDGDGRPNDTDYGPRDPSVQDPPSSGCITNCVEVNPGDDLDAKINAASAGATILVHGAEGTVYNVNDAIVLEAGQRVIGDAGSLSSVGPATVPDPKVTVRAANTSMTTMFRSAGDSITIKWLELDVARAQKSINGEGGSPSQVMQYVVCHDSRAACIGQYRGDLLDSEIYRGGLDPVAFDGTVSGIKCEWVCEVARSYIHDNRGNGIWCDVGCATDALHPNGFWVHDNVVGNNGRNGIFYENAPRPCVAGNDPCNDGDQVHALIEGNYSYGNSNADSNRAGIQISDAANGEVRNNVLGKTPSGQIVHNVGSIGIRLHSSNDTTRGVQKDAYIHDNQLNGEIIKGTGTDRDGTPNTGCGDNGNVCTNN